VFYALAGNIAINNCFNAQAVWAALGAQSGEISVPELDYLRPSSFGSLELRHSPNTEFIGQSVDYSSEHAQRVKMIPIDDLHLDRLDLLKLDVEGMELEVLAGAEKSISRLKPQMSIERLKADESEIRTFAERLGYRTFPFGLNLLAIHESDPAASQVSVV
jgi:FkbM family methyltransferase